MKWFPLISHSSTQWMNLSLHHSAPLLSSLLLRGKINSGTLLMSAAADGIIRRQQGCAKGKQIPLGPSLTHPPRTDGTQRLVVTSSGSRRREPPGRTRLFSLNPWAVFWFFFGLPASTGGQAKQIVVCMRVKGGEARRTCSALSVMEGVLQLKMDDGILRDLSAYGTIAVLQTHLSQLLSGTTSDVSHAFNCLGGWSLISLMTNEGSAVFQEVSWSHYYMAVFATNTEGYPCPLRHHRVLISKTGYLDFIELCSLDTGIFSRLDNIIDQYKSNFI